MWQLIPVATRWCFRSSRRPRTWIRRRLHTSMFFSHPRLKMSVKNAFSCFQSRNKCTVPPRHDPMALQSFYICRERWSLVFAKVADTSPRSLVLAQACFLFCLLSPVIVSYSCAKTDNFVFSGLVRKTKLRSF